MRAITVRQPWAWAIIHGQKDVENRSRNIAGKYRGPIAITAALKFDEDNDLARRLPVEVPWPYEGFDRGVVLGVVDIVGVHLSRATIRLNPTEFCRPVCFVDGPPIGELCSEWAQFMPYTGYHITLANPRPLPTPIPVRGRLGLWTLPDDVAAQVVEALR